MIGLIVILLTGCSGPSSTKGAAGGRGVAATAVGIGAPARDGKFEFTVTSVDRSKIAGNPDNEFEQSTAQGEFINVHLTVKNIGDEAQSYFASNQKLIVGGKEFDAASILGIPGDMKNLNPGLGIATVVSFDVLPGSVPEAIELHDSAFSGGVTVKLS
ncbi:DUF4352 domain-containing protein [Mycobacterium sp. CSUR Q5927]|nr:DUF4352 domain-containing protein [Mycobacterium sp. CSUR Q5927]